MRNKIKQKIQKRKHSITVFKTKVLQLVECCGTAGRTFARTWTHISNRVSAWQPCLRRPAKALYRLRPCTKTKPFPVLQLKRARRVDFESTGDLISRSSKSKHVDTWILFMFMTYSATLNAISKFSLRFSGVNLS